MSLLERKRGTDPRRTQRAYMQGLQDERQAAARKADAKAYDAYVKDQFQRLFPGK